MKTNFFSQLNPMIDGFDIQMTIKKIDGKLTLAIFSEPRIDDDARKRIPPLNFIATAKELDDNFFSEVEKPMSAISGFSINMKKFEIQMAATEAETQMARKTDEENRKKKTEAKVKLDRGKELLEAGKPRQAISVFQEALKIYPGYPEATKFLVQAKSKAGLGADLFDTIPEKNSANTQGSSETGLTETRSSDQPTQTNGEQSATISKIAEASNNVFIESNTDNHASN